MIHTIEHVIISYQYVIRYCHKPPRERRDVITWKFLKNKVVYDPPRTTVTEHCLCACMTVVSIPQHVDVSGVSLTSEGVKVKHFFLQFVSALG